jgi:hypothetical protein
VWIAHLEMVFGLLPVTLWFAASSVFVPFALWMRAYRLVFGGSESPIYFVPLAHWGGGAIGLAATWGVLLLRSSRQRVGQPGWVLAGLAIGCGTAFNMASTNGLSGGVGTYVLLAPVVVALHQGAALVRELCRRAG